jgi:hypothetical protein
MRQMLEAAMQLEHLPVGHCGLGGFLDEVAFDLGF